MRNVSYEITKEQYDEMKAASPAEARSMAEDIVPISWVCGYGFYGFYLSHPDESTYLIKGLIGDSCD
jgi:hypothetical protein